MERPGQIKLKNDHGERLYRAVEAGKIETVRNLVGLAHDTDISQALIGAVTKNDVQMVNYLLGVGAKMGLYNKLSYRLAKKLGFQEIVEIFEKIIKHSQRIGNINPNVRELVVPRLKPVAERVKIEKSIEKMLPAEFLKHLTNSGLRIKISALDKNLDVAICRFNRPSHPDETIVEQEKEISQSSLLDRVKNKGIGFEALTSTF